MFCVTQSSEENFSEYISNKKLLLIIVIFVAINIIVIIIGLLYTLLVGALSMIF
jgi:cytochrome c biogenesis factor